MILKLFSGMMVCKVAILSDGNFAVVTLSVENF